MLGESDISDLLFQSRSSLKQTLSLYLVEDRMGRSCSILLSWLFSLVLEMSYRAYFREARDSLKITRERVGIKRSSLKTLLYCFSTIFRQIQTFFNLENK